MPTYKPEPRTIRLQDFDYRQPGFYFITICVEKHKIMFGNIEDDKMHLNPNGLLIEQTWKKLPQRFPGIELDQYIIMPNHLHGILNLHDEQPILYKYTKTERVPQRFKASVQAGTRPYKQMPVLGEMIRSFKAEATYRLHRTGAPNFAWQRRFYESILSTEKDLAATRLYIVNNPARWALDKLYNKP
jgi:putative transposase